MKMMSTSSQPDGDGSLALGGEDGDHFIISSDSAQNNSEGSYYAHAHEPAPQDRRPEPPDRRPDPPGVHVTEDAFSDTFATVTSLDEASPAALINNYEDDKDNEDTNNNELHPLCRQPSTTSTATSQLDFSERRKLCEEGFSSPALAADYDDDKDNDGSNSNETLSLRRKSSIITTTSGSGFGSQKLCLSEDTFSFLIYSRPCRSCTLFATFFLATFVFAFQMAIYGVLANDITRVTDPMNRLKLPAGVEIPVRIAEALATVVAIITQDDVRKAVSLLRDGYNKDLANEFPGATKWKWSLSIFLRAVEGFIGLFLTFLLIMQSTTVIDLLLNFLAMEFVSHLDDVVFVLMREGFFGRDLKEEADTVSSRKYRVNHRSTRSSRTAWVVILLLFFVFAVMFIAWGIIFKRQRDGKYLCSPIFAQFGDEVVPMLGTFTGLYHLHDVPFGGRSSYIDEQKRGRERALLAYCREEKRWTLSLRDVNLPEGKVHNPCNWIAASEESTDFDVLTTANSQWVVKTQTKGVIPLSQHFLACHDCRSVVNMCGSNGMCTRGECKCNPGYYGLRCEYPEPCERLEIDPRDQQSFLKEGGDYFASTYYRLEGVKAYNRPVYTSANLDSESLSDNTDFIIFTGVRWILSYKGLFPDLKYANNASELPSYFSQFHGHFTVYYASYISEPVQIGSHLDDMAYPFGLQWREPVRIDSDLDLSYPATIRSHLMQPSASDEAFDQRLQPDSQKGYIEKSVICAVCNNSTNPCFEEASCQNNGICDCPDGYSGAMCQVPPSKTSNGYCDPYFNKVNFDFDGGDCCENTCRSTSEYACGKTGQGYIDTGYPLCNRLPDQWEMSGDPIYGVSSASRSGRAVALSGNGKILAVGDPGVSIVRLFDKDGAGWRQRGPHMQGPSDSNFGASISLSNESKNIVQNSRTFPKVTLVVGAPKIGLARVFTCSTDRCIQRGEDIIGSGGFGSSISIANDGNSIAVGGAEETISQEMTTNGEVKVFTWSNNTWGKGERVSIARPQLSISDNQYSLQGYYVSLSNDYLAVGTLEGDVTAGPRYESAKLITQVFKWNKTGWTQLGDEIKKDFYVDKSFRDSWPLKSIVIKGSVLVIGSKASVAVYEWNGASQWIPREIELSSADNGFTGWSVDLSEDASVLAVGTSVEDPTPTDESIQMYQWNGTRYTALFHGVPGGTVNSVSLSSDGRAVAVGSPYDMWRGGSTRVYNFRPSSPCDDPSEIPLHLSFTTDNNPEETSWELRVDSQVKRVSGSFSGHKYTTYVEEICVPATSCMRFIVYDSRGDGLNRPGVFAIMLNGTEVARGDGGFKFYDMKSFGECSCLEDEVPFTLGATSNFYNAKVSLQQLQQNNTRYTGRVLTMDASTANDDNSFSTFVVDECIPKGCYVLSFLPSDRNLGAGYGKEISYNAIYNDESTLASISCDPNCQGSHNFFGECDTAGEEWQSDLQWADLKLKLSSSASLVDTGFTDYASECIPEFVNFQYAGSDARVDTWSERSTFALINQPSGLCLPHLSCAYDLCNPNPNGYATQTFETYQQDMDAMARDRKEGFEVPDAFDPALPGSYFYDPFNPSLNLPSKVLHPVVASDVVAAIGFAKEHGLEVSVKNSGHSYQGASSKKDTLHINMNRYTTYAPTGITSCDAESLGIAIKDDLSDQPCHLSVAKNKPSVIRVGGGENWDKVYRAVKDANEAQEQEEEGMKYHIVGGAAGSVSPMGWSFQGGLSGTTGGSKYGLGADQVVQIEMVLPNGFHVKFGPTEWKDATAEGFIVPKTIGVTGLCRSNPEEQDEEKWIWEDCPDDDDFDVDFLDLWYAVRGGGGGTWGVVLSMHLQLHELVPFAQYEPSSSEECLATAFENAPFENAHWHPTWVEFMATYAITPSVLNVTEEQSHSCGCPSGVNMLMCYGEENVSQGWMTFLRMKNMTEGADCLVKSGNGDGLPSVSAPGTRFEGQILDSPSPGLEPGGDNGILIPRSWIEKVGVQSAMDIFGLNSLGVNAFAMSYYAFGSAAFTSDQANSVSRAHRYAGTMIQGYSTDESFWREIASELYNLENATNFPPIYGSNHATNGLTGPLKDDWSKSCPSNWTFEDRLAGCVSFQESIYGTETLERLKAIKEVVDPKNMFNCNNCIENNRVEAHPPPAPANPNLGYTGYTGRTEDDDYFWSGAYNAGYYSVEYDRSIFVVCVVVAALALG